MSRRCPTDADCGRAGRFARRLVRPWLHRGRDGEGDLRHWIVSHGSGRGPFHGDARVPTTLAWVIDKSPTYALEGNILSSGATLAWAADLLTDGSVADLVALAETVPDSGGVTLVPAFAGLGAPHWDRTRTRSSPA